MARRKTLPGFDYRTGRPVEAPISEWREHLRHLIEKGGFRRVEFGETFGHGKHGRIEFEVYGRVNL